MLPDVVQTVAGLAERAIDLARTLRQMEGQVDDDALVRLEERIAQISASLSRRSSSSRETDGEDDRRLGLLERQQAGLKELVGRRRNIEAQFESCVLAVQNVRFDLLRLRSAGVSAVLDDLTSATQAARALSLDVEAAIAAAAEIREELRP